MHKRNSCGIWAVNHALAQEQNHLEVQLAVVIAFIYKRINIRVYIIDGGVGGGCGGGGGQWLE